MKILVTGGAGFIGSHVVDTVFAAGHSVRVFDRAHNPWRKPLEGVHYYLGDFSDRVQLAEALQGVDVVVHLISTTVPSTSNYDPIGDISSNLVNTVQLLQLMGAMGVSRIVYFSSGGTVYGIPQQVPIPEDAPLNPICSYGVIKVAIEKYLAMFQHLYRLSPLILRPSNPFGPRQGHLGVQGVVGTFMRKIVDGDQITVWGDGMVQRDYIDVRDLARLSLAAIESKLTGTFNVGYGKGTTINEVIAAIERVTGRTANTSYIAQRQFDVPEIVLDITKAKAAFGWQPEVAFDEGLMHYYQWLVQEDLAGEKICRPTLGWQR